MASLWDIIQEAGETDEFADITKSVFGVLVHSKNQADVDRALDALEAAGGYENLGD